MHHVLHKRMVIALLTTSLIANGISRWIFGSAPVFGLQSQGVGVPFYDVIILGVVCGLLGALYTKSTLVCGGLYAKIALLKPYQRVLIPTVLAGLMGVSFPILNTGGGAIISRLAGQRTTILILVALLLGKWLLTVVCTSSGAASGAFFPVLTVGALIGAIMGSLFQKIGMDASVLTLCMILGAGAFFAAVMHTPMTSMVMMLEVTGSLTLGSAIILVCLSAYLTAWLMPVGSLNQELYQRMIK